jgi:hypothetical protein
VLDISVDLLLGGSWCRLGGRNESVWLARYLASFASGCVSCDVVEAIGVERLCTVSLLKRSMNTL